MHDCFLALSESRMVLGVGDGLWVFSLTQPEDEAKRINVNISSPTAQVIDGVFSNDGQRFTVLLSSKRCLLFDNEWRMEREWTLAKTPTAILFDSSGGFVLVADRAGNVTRYSVEGHGEEEGELLLGHLSMLLAMRLSPDGRHLVTADRDEKVRISRYPQTYLIEHYSLAHSSFISALDVSSQWIFSSGGDARLVATSIDDGRVVALMQLKLGNVRRLSCRRESVEGKILVALLFAQLEQVALVTFDVSMERFSTPMIIAHSSPLFDIRVHSNGSLFALSSEAIVQCECVDSNGEEHFEDFARLDQTTTEAILSSRSIVLPSLLTKNVAFDNQGQYMERKRERVEKQKRRRQ